MDKDRKPGLDDAYALKTPEDSRRLYRDWAATYDKDFATERDYVYHHELAALFLNAGATGPVLDVGCGTGLVGAALGALAPDFEIDGVDISPEMLEAARAKGVYRELLEADLTRPLPAALAGAYGGVISAGTFTHGHVGPAALDELLSVAEPHALLALGVNAEVYEAEGFAARFAALATKGEIVGFRVETGRVYGPGAAHDHAESRFQAAIFRRAG